MRSAFYSSKTGTSRRRLKGLGQFDDEFLSYEYQPADTTTAPVGSPTTWESVLQAIPNLAQTYYSLEYTKEIQDINLQRLREGKPPLSSTQMQQIAPQVSVGVAPQTQNMIMYLALGLGAVLLVMPMLSKR